MPILKVINLDRRKPESCVLEPYRTNVHSQFGEDGIIARVFELIEPRNKWCVEFGAWDGLHLSNTCSLIKDHGWSGVQIEGSEERFEDLKRNFAGMPNSFPLHKRIGFKAGKDTIDDALATLPVPRDFDLISIDIDGNDYYIWDSIKTYVPRVVVIEFNPTIPNDVIFVQDRNMDINQGSSLAALVELGKSKGYELAAATNCNGIFVHKDDSPKLGIADNSIDALRANVTGRIFHCYDGTVYNHMRPLQWTGRGGERPTMDQFQILSPKQRIFYDNLEESAKGTTIAMVSREKPQKLGKGAMRSEKKSSKKPSFRTRVARLAKKILKPSSL